MRPQLFKYSVALLFCVPCSVTLNAHAAELSAEWNGSYAANGQCFCAGEADSSVAGKIFPTPIGGQTVSQICQRIGDGPGLERDGGLFNYPVYADPQCGHGPFSQNTQSGNAECLGSLDGLGSEGCEAIGPKWSVKQAFSKKPIVAEPSTKSASTTRPQTEAPKITASAKPKVTAAQNTPNKTAPTGLLTQPVVTSVTVKDPSSKGGENKTLKATVISSASTAGRDLPEQKPLAPFTGRVINIDGRRYLQAKNGLPAQGGKPGSRIVLDGLVFLKDDGSIKPTDLFRAQARDSQKNAERESSSRNESSQAVKNAASKSTKQQEVVADRSPAKKQQSSKADRALSIITAESTSNPSQSAGKPSTIKTSRVDSVLQNSDSVGEIRDTDQTLNLSLVEPRFTPRDSSIPDRSDRNAVPRSTNTNVLKPDSATRKVVTLSQPRFNDRLQASASVGARAVDTRVANSQVADVKASTKASASSVATEETQVAQLNTAPITNPDISSKSDISLSLDPSAEIAQTDKIATPEIMDPPTLSAALPTESVDTIDPETVVGEELSSRATDVRDTPVTVSALKLPNNVVPRQEKFSYIEAIPAAYDVGGGGVVLNGSAESHSRFHYVGRIGVANTYQELRVGGGYYLTPASADRFTFMLEAGVEHGVFNLNDQQDPTIAVDFSDTGLFVGAASRLVLSRHFELKGGVGYSTFFEGDPTVFGAAYLQLSRQFDLVSSFELGDNDLFGLGVRFYY